MLGSGEADLYSNSYQEHSQLYFYNISLLLSKEKKEVQLSKVKL